MADFEVLVEEVQDVYDHPNADRLSIVKIRNYNCISAKVDGEHRYDKGELVVYVPEGAVVPENLLRMGFWNDDKDMGILAGSKGNRVKAIKLRDIVSQGIIFPIERRADLALVDSWNGAISISDDCLNENLVGKDVADILDITKYEPEIPTSMSGEVEAQMEFADKYDIENVKKYSSVFQPGEQVFFTEKLHGTNCRFIITEEFIGATSKGLGKQGLIFKNNDTNSVSNVYVRMMNELMPKLQKVQEYLADMEPADKIYIYGEIYGKGIQDLVYDAPDKPKFRFFDVKFTWYDKSESYWDKEQLEEFATNFNLDLVPEIYTGSYSPEAVTLHTSGKSTLGSCIREGIVIKPIMESENHWIGRKFLKSVSDAYLMRKGGTEFS